MKVEIKQHWLEALRGNQYTQGRRYLRRPDNTFCCLGVLCDIVDPNAWVKTGVGGMYSHSADYTALLPPPIALAAGIGDGVDLDFIMRMNDTGKSFAEIADWIETNVPTE
jgi:hypothetical protein